MQGYRARVIALIDQVIHKMTMEAVEDIIATIAVTTVATAVATITTAIVVGEVVEAGTMANTTTAMAGGTMAGATEMIDHLPRQVGQGMIAHCKHSAPVSVALLAVEGEVEDRDCQVILHIQYAN